MIRAGGIIGIGLFVGSSTSIAAGGPFAIVSYVLGGIAMLMIMRSIAEMSGPDACVGPFTELIRRSLGDGAGFVSSWLYWYFWVLVIPIETLVAANILHAMSGLPVWQIGLVLLTAMVAINLASLRSYGEFEFWLSAIKVISILAFTAIAAVYLLRSGGVGGGLQWAGQRDLQAAVPAAGIGTILVGLPSAIFAFTGAEIVTMVAADSSNPARAIGWMTRSLARRIVLFYVVPLTLVVLIVPWREIVPGISPFASALAAMHIPGGALIMNVVVLVAALSCLNSALYVTSGVLRTLAGRKDAPGWLVGSGSADRLRSRTILFSSLLGYVAIAGSIESPEAVFTFLVNMSGAVMMFVYLLLSLSDARARLGRRDSLTKIQRVPWRSIAIFLFMATALAQMAMSPDFASQLYSSLLAVIFFISVVAIRCLWRLRMPGEPTCRALSGSLAG